MNKFTLYLGLNDAQLKEQVIKTEDALSIVYHLLLDEYGLSGATIQQANGIYKHANGQIVVENTIVIILLDIDDDLVNNIIHDLKIIFNQECILKEVSNVEFGFV